ncbi:MAG: NAD-dependent epimerase/dehydratase family protein [Myxococcota bacterium]
MRVFVTGGTGFLGSAVVRSLRAYHHEVVAIARPNADRRDLESMSGVDVITGTFDDPDALRESMRGCDGLCHVAGAAGRYYRARDHYDRSNEQLSLTVFRAARQAGIRRAVYTGTVAMMYGQTTPYAASKRRGAEAARREAEDAMEVVAVHPSGMIGPWDRKPTPMGRAIASFTAGTMRAVVGGGSGYIHVDDAAAGHVAALERGEPGRDYILDAEYWTTPDLFAALAEITGRKRPMAIPVGLANALAVVIEPLYRMFGKTPPLTTFTTSYLSLPRSAHHGGEEARVALGLGGYRTIETALEDAVRWFRDRGEAAEKVR